MVSKKHLAVAAVCTAVLLVAVGAYAYLQTSNKTKENTFNFSWEGSIAEQFNVTTFWMKITFERPNETNLIITVKTNHLRFREVHPDYVEENGTYAQVDHMGIVFDSNNNGELDEADEGIEYFMYGWKRWCYLDAYDAEGQRRIGSCTMGEVNPVHRVTFDSELGYTYVIPYALSWYPERHPGMLVLDLSNDLVHVEYNGIVAVEFNFGMELIT